MSMAYIEDLQLLREVPEAVWLFVCGVPTDNALVLPLLVGLGMLTLLLGVLLGLFDWLRKRYGWFARRSS
jgi:hypothetical protein